MEKLILPLVESLVSSYKGPSLTRVKIIGIQHILETTHAMFRSLYKLGLRPENISLLGKCYSTCYEVYKEMTEEGIDVSPASFTYSSHEAYDEQFSKEVQKFFSSRTNDLSPDKYDYIIILDDGGKCITLLNQYLQYPIPIFGIEQTSSGYEAIRNLSLPFPVINVARSPVKLELESPMIAQAAAERLYLSLQKNGISPDRALIVGGGAIGKAMENRLSSDMEIVVHDLKNSQSQNIDIENLLSHFPLIVGCTGKTSIPYIFHSLLSPYTTLVSVSSSDREFDAFHLRKLVPKISDCHQDLLVRNLLLVRSGFPVNFDGSRENIDPELIQLTIALITAGILQALSALKYAKNEILPLNLVYEEKIKNEFIQSSTVQNKEKILSPAIQ